MKRRCGVLMPISSLPSKYGIGCFSKEAYEFADFLAAGRQAYWQILPLGQTGYGDSPYQSFSTFAGNPYFIDLDEFVKLGYITDADLEAADWGDDPMYVDYGKIYNARFGVLRKAYQASPYTYGKAKVADFEQFCEDNAAWLTDYALFSAVKNHFEGKCFIEWDEDIRTRQPEAIAAYSEKLADEIRFYEFQQYFFNKQWMALKAYVNSKGVEIVGDIPIYVAFDSADTWSHPELFKLDSQGYPTKVAGVPPDGFSATGQLWGNPIYKWDYHKETGFAWWISRISTCFKLYDIIRIDHFRGFDEYYEIPYGDKTAERGVWAKGPGYDIFAAIKEALGDVPIIAEDLGYLTDTVIKLVKDTGYPGMKVLEFGFDPREASDYLPHTYDRNCVVYTGTHDNETAADWYKGLSETDREFCTNYTPVTSEETAADDLIRLAMQSVGDTVIIPLQDYLNLGNEARINHPSTLGGINWRWRLKKGQNTPALAEHMKLYAEVYRRV